MFGPGRPASKPEILDVRVLTAEDISGYAPEPNQNAVKKLRDSHHRIAKLVAIGLRNFEIAEITGYSIVRISTLKATPAFQDLVEHYRKSENLAFSKERDLYYENLIKTRTLAGSELYDRLTEDPEKFTISQLIALHGDTADRTGYPKRSVAVNVNLDFASRLERARTRSEKVIELTPVASESLPRFRSGGGEGEENHPRQISPPPQALKRRA